MQTIKMRVNIENWCHKTPIVVKDALTDIFGGQEALMEEALSTIQATIESGDHDVWDNMNKLQDIADNTIDVMFQNEDVTVNFLRQASKGFYYLMFDLHQAVTPHLFVVNGRYKPVTVYVTDVIDDPSGTLWEETTLELEVTARPKSNPPNGRTRIRMDMESVFDWAPYLVQPFIKGVIVDIIKYVVQSAIRAPVSVRGDWGTNVFIRALIKDCVKKRLHDAVFGQNQTDTEIYYCYVDHIRSGRFTLRALEQMIVDYLESVFRDIPALDEHVLRHEGKYSHLNFYESSNEIVMEIY